MFIFTPPLYYYTTYTPKRETDIANIRSSPSTEVSNYSLNEYKTNLKQIVSRPFQASPSPALEIN